MKIYVDHVFCHEDTSGDFSCNVSQYCVQGRNGFLNSTVMNRLGSFLTLI